MTLPAERLRPTERRRTFRFCDPCPPAMRRLLESMLPIAAAEFGVSIEQIVARTKPPQVVRARAFVAWSLRSLERPFSYPVIGDLLGQHHTSAMFLHEKAILLRLSDRHFRTVCDRFAAAFIDHKESPHGDSRH